MRLHADVRGRGPGTPVVLLHGFTGDGGSWAGHRDALALGRRVVAVDLPGHGRSPLPPPGAGLDDAADAIVDVLDRLDVARAIVVGYSLGGRVALHLAPRHPVRVAALVVESASPGIADADTRRARTAADDALAEAIERDGLAAFVAGWETQPLFTSQARLPATVRDAVRARRLAQSPRGLAAALRAFGVGRQAPLHEALRAVACPTLLLAGADDATYVAHATDMASRLPHARVVVVPGAGHTTHLENPAAFRAAVLGFVADVERPQGPARGERPSMHIEWTTAHAYEDIRYETAEGIAKITINRPEVRNAFRPKTLHELRDAFHRAHEDATVGVVILTGEGPHAFCSGGDQRIRGEQGYVGDDGVPRLNVLDLQKQIRSLPKPVIAMVAGYAIGGGHVLHVVCDLTVAADNARFGQTGPRVGSFDGGFGASHLARIVGHKKAREIWYLCEQYDAQEALAMGLVNKVVPLARLEEETVAWCRRILQHSPLALRCLKSAFNADTDGLAGIQELAGNATLLYYMSEEAQEGRNAYLEKRAPDFARFKRLP